MQKELLCMATEAERRAVRKYQAKCKEVRITYTEKNIRIQ